MNLNYLSISPLQFTLLWFVGSNLCLRNFAYLLLLLVLVRVYGFLWLCLAEVPFFMCFLRLIFQCFCDARGGEWFGVLMHSTPFLFNLLSKYTTREVVDLMVHPHSLNCGLNCNLHHLTLNP